jgi:glycosyltransferase involved in cell wall biosynthesis
VVARACIGCVDVVQDGENGLLVPRDRIEQMVGATARLVRDPDLRRRLGQAGAASVRERYALRRNVESIARIYRQLMR